MQYLFHSIYYSTNDSRAKSTEATAAAAKPSTPLQVRYEDHAWNASYGGRKVWSYILEPEMPKGPVPIVPLVSNKGRKKNKIKKWPGHESWALFNH
ncbi:hypothetical protein CEXT_158941 [Caerostris extrusa]|uniref:Uncharacterized protein n=1 Tax=Caerostris extrusa TaxID=172846 RepID=A0AAV4XLE9_CAEEX|nr:hypothetical protein CEXT_158941 [Caerostris extrusa]